MSSEIINIIGPALRGLLAGNSETLKRVSFSATASSQAKALAFALPSDLSAPGVVEALRTSLADYEATHHAKPRQTTGLDLS